MRGVLARVRSFWHGLRKPAQVDADMADEMRFHIEMEAQRLMTRQGSTRRKRDVVPRWRSAASRNTAAPAAMRCVSAGRADCRRT